MHIDFDGLVTAYIDEHHWRRRTPKLRDYFSQRLALLEHIFGTSLHREGEPSASLSDAPAPYGVQLALEAMTRAEVRDRSEVVRLAKACLKLGELYGPFSAHFEGQPGEMATALGARHAAPLRKSIDQLKKQYRELLKDALALLYPHAVYRTSSERALRELGLPDKPDMEWAFFF